ncbi:MAG TPA: SsrA-binding protein SmpB [Bacteroidetes bacterium]|nr:SsrA-binding protein SmpB [Bacteroidota bacterium]
MPYASPEIKNRKAFHDYEILERLEAGLVLTGPEVKSVREGRVSLREAHVNFDEGAAVLVGMAIASYERRGYAEQHPHRPKKLLLHRREINRLARKVQEKGLTVIPLRVYFNDRGYAKVEIGLARGKRQYDKRAAIAAREAKRDLARAKRETERWNR